jgi:hypothetical protein
MSIIPVAFSSSALSSSGVKITYWSFANSYPLTVSSRPTVSLSLMQMYCCLRREPHFLWSMLNDTLDFDSDAEKRQTGTDTRPNEIVALAIERAGMEENRVGRLTGPGNGVGRTVWSSVSRALP